MIATNRAGFTLTGAMLYLIVLTMVAGVIDSCAPSLLRALRPAPPAAEAGAVLDAACDALRRDLARGASIDGEVLIAGGHRWDVAGGWLRRDGTHRVARCTARLAANGGVVEVALVPCRGASRRLVGRERQ